jgi:hypothetical protein
MIFEYADGRIVCAECAGLPVVPLGDWSSFRAGEQLPETKCAHVRRIRSLRWEAKRHEAKQAAEDLEMKRLLWDALDGIPDEELVPGPPPEWMVA